MASCKGVENSIKVKLSQAIDPGGSKDSQLTIRQKDTLKGRFRITNGPSKGKQVSQSTKEKETVKASKLRAVQSTLTKDSTNSSGDVTADHIYADTHPNTPWDLVKAPSQGRGDPFSAFPIPLTDNDDKLIRFFISRFDLRATIAYIRKQWWEGYAFSDPLLMHTTLGLAAALWSQLLPDPRKVANEGCKQKALAIRGVRARLSQGINDMILIGTIANLANIEGTEGNYAVACVHLRAVDLLIRARQGYDELKENVNVARVINWSDIQAAIGLGTKPILPMILTMDMISLPFRILEVADTPSLRHLGVFESSSDDTTVQDNFSLVRQAQYSLKSEDVPMQDFRVLINVVDHHLQTTLGGDGLTSQGRILVTAAHAFFYLIIRELVPSHHLPRAILGRLREQLQEGFMLFANQAVFQPGLLWCLVIGASAAFESGQDWDFFSGNLSKALVLLGVSNSLELEVILADFLWHEKFPGKFLAQYSQRLFPPMLETS
ncbi:hypothetical protein CEP54_012990 [Fusarium duplospermum]|uniref:Tachykinin family protein n=1 Tax=Fusarium duplospermum TaxID=1325734 RepID=A0A428P5L3_9HYPO|nr:hypothetical protein CEP54_012990 [Fusarium duplospermum]